MWRLAKKVGRRRQIYDPPRAAGTLATPLTVLQVIITVLKKISQLYNKKHDILIKIKLKLMVVDNNRQVKQI